VQNLEALCDNTHHKQKELENLANKMRDHSSPQALIMAVRNSRSVYLLLVNICIKALFVGNRNLVFVFDDKHEQTTEKGVTKHLDLFFAIVDEHTGCKRLIGSLTCVLS